MLLSEDKVPATRASLGADLVRLGVEAGTTLIVHASLSSLGYVVGGAEAVIHALMDVLGPEGTLVMPSFSGFLNDPAGWTDPPAPQSWLPILYEHMPVFDPARTPTRKMGAIAEAFRTWPGARRSNHPVMSLVAWGRHVEAVTAHHALAFALGEGTPMSALYALGARILLLGVGHERNSSLHLAETRAPHGRRKMRRMLVVEDGRRDWRDFPDVIDDRGQFFPELGAAFDATGRTRFGRVGEAESRLMAQRELVDFGIARLEARLAPKKE